MGAATRNIVPIDRPGPPNLSVHRTDRKILNRWSLTIHEHRIVMEFFTCPLPHVFYFATHTGPMNFCSPCFAQPLAAPPAGERPGCLAAGTVWNCARRGSADTIIAVAAKNDAPENGSYAEWHLLKLPSASAPMEPR